MTGKGTEITLALSPVNFGDQTVGTTGTPMTITVTNHGEPTPRRPLARPSLEPTKATVPSLEATCAKWAEKARTKDAGDDSVSTEPQARSLLGYERAVNQCLAVRAVCSHLL